jgi:pentatricopeptide repeat protein
MYAKCGNIVDEQRAFSNMAVCDMVTWNSMILGDVKCGQRLKALELSQEMQCEGVQQDTVIFVGLLNKCTSAAMLQQGRHVHEQTL